MTGLSAYADQATAVLGAGRNIGKTSGFRSADVWAEVSLILELEVSDAAKPGRRFP